MLKVRVIPSLLLEKGKLVKTVNFKNPNYIGDPVNAIKIYNDKEVDELAFLDIRATSNDKIDFKKITEIADECFMPLTYGGGINNIEDMRKIYSLGVEKIIICSHAVEKPEFVTEAARIFGNQSVVVAIDVKKNIRGKYKVYTNSGAKPTKIDAIDFAQKMEQAGAGEIFLNSIDRDGTFSGYDTKLISLVSKAVRVPLIACGGAGKIEDFERAIKAGASAVAAGSIFVYFRNKVDGVLINYPSKKELKGIRDHEK